MRSPECRITLCTWAIEADAKGLGSNHENKFSTLSINCLSTISFAWQRPNFIFTLSGFMDLFDKIVLKSDIYLVGKRTVNSFNEPIPNNNIVLNDNDEVELLNEVVNEPFVYNLKPFLDMNLSAEYRYNKKISGFIQFNNFTGKKYQYWTNFPTQSINILGGITFSF